MITMEVLTGFLTITLPILVSHWLGNRQTQKIIRNTNEQTQRIIENTNTQILKVLNEIKQLQLDMKCLLEKTHALQKDTKCLLEKTHALQKDTLFILRKLDFGFKANALMHGWRRADGISPEEAAKLPEPKIYDTQLRICYYKAD
jgi:hypothetical protein